MEDDKQLAGNPPRTPQEVSGEEHFVSLPRRQVVFIMSGVLLAMFLASLDQTVVVTAIPRIIADLDGFDRFTWVTTAYLLASTTVVPIVGKMSDMYGRKWFFVFGIAIFLVGSVLAGLSQNMTQLIIFRGVQGIGGGTIMANSLITVADLFPPEERGKYQGLLGSVFALSSLFGPTVGGFITDQLSWHWVFFINLPVGIPIIALFIVLFPRVNPSKRERRLDITGIATLIFAVVPLLLALSWGGSQYDWVSAQILGLFGFAAAMTLVFLANERRAYEPIMPLWIFSHPTVTISLVAVFLTGFAFFGIIVFVPLYFQGVLGSSPTDSGSFLTPMMLAMVVGGILSGQALSRFGGHYRLQGLLGVGALGAGIFLLSRMTAATSHSEAVGNIVLAGIGLGLSFPVYTLVVQNSVRREVLGVVTSSVQFFRSIGGTLGLAILGSTMTSRFASGLNDRISPDLRSVIPPEQLAGYADDPYALLSPDANRRLLEGFESAGPQAVVLFDGFVTSLREALASAITDAFLIALFLVIAAWVVTLFLKGAPMRQVGQPQREVRPAVAQGGDA